MQTKFIWFSFGQIFYFIHFLFFNFFLDAAGNFLCPAEKLSYNGLKTGKIHTYCMFTNGSQWMYRAGQLVHLSKCPLVTFVWYPLVQVPITWHALIMHFVHPFWIVCFISCINAVISSFLYSSAQLFILFYLQCLI